MISPCRRRERTGHQ